MQTSVLIVDDSDMVREVMHAFLEKLTDWNITGEAASGMEAIQKAVELKPDLILLDFSMPGMNGIETASVLKKTLPDSYVILFTMFDKSLNSRLSSAAGVDLVVSKSEGLNYLVEAVHSLIKDAGPSRGKVIETARQGLPPSPR